MDKKTTINDYAMNIIKDIECFQEDSTSKHILENDSEIYEDELIIFIGDSKYPTRKLGITPRNVKGFGIYNRFHFNRVAFLCDVKTLELFSIAGILFGSLDLAGIVIDYILKNQLMNTFAQYLFYRKKVVLVNADGKIPNINSLLRKYPKHKVCFCCGDYHKKYKISSFKNLNSNKTNGKNNSFIKLLHPSPKAYRNGFQNACSCYLDHTYRDNQSNLSIQDFKVF